MLSLYIENILQDAVVERILIMCASENAGNLSLLAVMCRHLVDIIVII